MSWFEDALVYQIYPLGLLGAPYENSHDGPVVHRLPELAEWIGHLLRLGTTCVLLNPVFESGSHGYDTWDYLTVDRRLGTNDDLRDLVKQLHDAGMHVILDTVLNHVGRDFWAFADVREKREASPYASWFNIDWSRDNQFGDGFSYECWEGVPELVKLNHRDFGCNDMCVEVIRTWEREFDIDGLRLDVAYCLDLGFLGYLRRIADELSAKRGEKFLLLGECLHGDYNRWMNDGACDSVTNYEAYKGLWSSFNAANMHEIAYALERQSGSHPWDLYTGRHLLDFLDNHDVPRIATKLDDKRQLVPLWGLLFGMVGTPCIYYGSEWGIEGEKTPGDRELRPTVGAPVWNELTDLIAQLAEVRA
ncbi:MAG: maltodextrin glucosidase, partial [Atopobiaceae bacterium]|nr:maltodextrin glucosidase [Atopobiaceae bacterium]